MRTCGPSASRAGSYDFDVFHFTGLHREYTTNGEVQAMVNQAAANINNEKGGAASNKTLSLQVEKVVLTEHGIQLIVDQDRYGFSPFVLSWAKKDTGGGDHGGGDHGGTTYYTLRYESNGGQHTGKQIDTARARADIDAGQARRLGVAAERVDLTAEDRL